MLNLQTAPSSLDSAILPTFPAAPTIPANSSIPLRKRPRALACPPALQRPLRPIQVWLDAVEIQDAAAARLLYKIIPGQCPFERDVTLFGRTLFHIPPLCKLNPFYEQLVGVRFRAMCYLVDECGESLESIG
ncbi:MAG: hypothetical protein RLZZ511_540 [Cyanobacteriota bacterium]|jgi:hypothetical protein